MVGGGANRALEVWSGKGGGGGEGGRGVGLKCIIGLECPISTCPGELRRGCGDG